MIMRKKYNICRLFVNKKKVRMKSLHTWYFFFIIYIVYLYYSVFQLVSANCFSVYLDTIFNINILSYFKTFLDKIFCEYRLEKLVIAMIDLILSDLIIMRYIVLFLRYFLAMLRGDFCV